MDIERDLRADLIDALSPDFLCFQEVKLRHALFPNRSVRADVVAIPIDREFWGHALAFEVKVVTERSDYAFWSSAIRQAHDYVYAHIDSDDQNLIGRRISAALVYPGPRYMPYLPRVNPPLNAAETVMISGAFHSALHFRVGRARRDENRRDKRMGLYMGPNEFWAENHGFTGQAVPLLKNKRPIGSQRIDVTTELGGLGDCVPYPEFE